MCLQCVTEAEIFANDPDDCEVLPGYALVRATKNAPEWAKGEWGLVRCNDPDLIWAGEILEAPDGWGDDDKLDNDPAHQRYFDAVSALGYALDDMSFGETMSLVSALGISPKSAHTFDVADQLMQRLAPFVQDHPAKSIDEWECIVRGCTMEEWEKFKKEVEDRNRAHTNKVLSAEQQEIVDKQINSYLSKQKDNE